MNEWMKVVKDRPISKIPRKFALIYLALWVEIASYRILKVFTTIIVFFPPLTEIYSINLLIDKMKKRLRRI